MKTTDHSTVNYVTHSGDDLLVVNAARVSFDKRSDWEYVPVYDEDDDEVWHVTDRVQLSERDQRLVKYLAKHKHWTPFGHPQITLHLKTPILVARQLAKHQVGMVWNEMSMRYVDSEPEFYVPQSWRARAENKKQGSSDSVVDVYDIFENDVWKRYTPDGVLLIAKSTYKALLEAGVCPEQARMILPLASMTEWFWTGSLAAWARVVGLRTTEDAQRETREVAEEIARVVAPLFPVSWGALMDHVGV